MESFRRPTAVAAALAAGLSISVRAQVAPDALGVDAPVRQLGVVTVNAGRPTSLPT